MIKATAPALVISTKAGQPPIGKPLIVQARGQLRLTWKLYAESPQSGEISLPDVTQNIGAGDLSALSHNRAEVPLFQYRPLPPLEMTIAAGSIQSFQRGTQIEKMLHRIRHFDRSEAEWRNLTPLWYSEHGAGNFTTPAGPCLRRR